MLILKIAQIQDCLAVLQDSRSSNSNTLSWNLSGHDKRLFTTLFIYMPWYDPKKLS